MPENRTVRGDSGLKSLFATFATRRARPHDVGNQHVVLLEVGADLVAKVHARVEGGIGQPRGRGAVI